MHAKGLLPPQCFHHYIDYPYAKTCKSKNMQAKKELRKQNFLLIEFIVLLSEHCMIYMSDINV